MVDDGLMDEVKHLYEMESLDPAKASVFQGIWKTIGYSEFRPCCEVGNTQEGEVVIEKAIARMQVHTRDYFRLQLEKIWLELLPALFQRQRDTVIMNVESKESFPARVEVPAIEQCKRLSDSPWARLAPSHVSTH